jgi:hypothetical protein
MQGTHDQKADTAARDKAFGEHGRGECKLAPQA